jgi:cytosine permease
MVGSAAHEIMKELAPALAFTDEVWMVITGILMASVAIWGYGAIVWLNRIAMPGLIILLIVLIYKVFVEFGDKLSAFEPSGDISFLAVIGLLPSGMAAALILGADYGRYVRPEGKASWAAPISVIIFFALLAFMGLVSSAVAGTWDPVQIFVDLGLGVFGLLMLILAAWTTNVSNIYVASLALSNMTKLSRQNTSIIATVIGIILALIGIYSLSGLQTWLSWITALLIPTSGVLLVDYYILNKQRLLTGELFKEKDSAYWYTGGWNLRAVIAWAFGAVLTFILPSTWIPAVTTLIATGIVYYLLSMNTQGIALKISNETTIGK